MNANQLVAQDIARLGAMFQGFLQFGAQLEQLGSIEQATNETNSRLLLVQAALEKANADVAAAQVAFDTLVAKADGLTAAAQKNAAGLTDSAAKEASRIVSQAEADAKALLAKAEDDAAAIRAAREDESASLVSQVAAAKAEIETLNGAITERQAQADSLTATINNVKAQIAALG